MAEGKISDGQSDVTGVTMLGSRGAFKRVVSRVAECGQDASGSGVGKAEVAGNR